MTEKIMFKRNPAVPLLEKQGSLNGTHFGGFKLHEN